MTSTWPPSVQRHLPASAILPGWRAATCLGAGTLAFCLGRLVSVPAAFLSAALALAVLAIAFTRRT